MSTQHERTPLNQLLRAPHGATPREQLQAVAAVLLGRGDVRSSIILGVDPWMGAQIGRASCRERVLRLV